MSVEKYTEYAVHTIAGRSPKGGDPDDIANIFLSNWGLVPADKNPLNLFKNAIPKESEKALLKIKTWREGSETRLALFFDRRPVVTSLDRGRVLHRSSNNGNGPDHFELVVEGIYLSKMTLSCGPAMELPMMVVSTASNGDPRPVVAVKQPERQENVISVVEDSGQIIIGQILGVPPRLVRPMEGQPRTFFDEAELREFAQNLKEQGQQTPAIVKVLPEPDENGCMYELISGERRWRACQIAELPYFKVIMSDASTDVDQFEQAVIANCHNVELSLLETIRSVGRLHDLGRTDEQIAKVYGKKTPQWATEYRKALTLDVQVLKLLGPETPEQDRLPFGVAKLLVGLPVEEQRKYATMASRSKISAKRVAFIVKGVREAFGIPTRQNPSEEFAAAGSFFRETNGKIENLVDYSDERFAALFANQEPDEIKRLFSAVRDCRDNLNVVIKMLMPYVKDD